MCILFDNENKFEDALVNLLVSEKGWKAGVLKYQTEEDLIQNWMNILSNNNKSIDSLNGYPLTRTEMQQILDDIKIKKTPLALNYFINGKTTSIVRDNPDDVAHLGKAITLKLYDKLEIAGGQTVYQIARQTYFQSKTKFPDRRGDVTLLINGMPVIHIELKKSGHDVKEACYQIEKYSKQGVFTGLFSLVQLFVAMTPEETLYFANPGPNGKFNQDYYFHWADYNNVPINNWQEIASKLLSIPMAHQMIGFYTIPDETDGILKVMRSYQYYAASAICDVVRKIDWDRPNNKGGFITCTTGGGKTLTSFKAAQLIKDTGIANKVVFLMDRIELGVQSLRHYRGFADSSETINATEDTEMLIAKLQSNNKKSDDRMIVTSIQKMSRITEESLATRPKVLEEIRKKRIVFIIDECHRSTFGDMLVTIKKTLPDAVLFGFTGTPIKDKNQKKMNTTSDIFGNELHRYSLADGMRDKNVLGFDVTSVKTYKDSDIRFEVAKNKAKINDISDLSKPGMDKNNDVFNDYMNPSFIPMAGFEDSLGRYHSGIEDYVPSSQYECDAHREKVVEDILDNYLILSRNHKFHSIFATSSITEAIEYYRLFKKNTTSLKVALMVSKDVDNTADATYKEEGIIEALDDYNRHFNKSYVISDYDSYRKDVSLRLAHKGQYVNIENTNEILDILIVVDQMLTGYDSKWINTLYLDKKLEYERIIQSFSRTNRLFGVDKPHGMIRYYRYPNTMKRNIEDAVKLYAGEDELSIFVDKLPQNLKSINNLYDVICDIFEKEGIQNFAKTPISSQGIHDFINQFIKLERCVSAATLQGLDWDKSKYIFKTETIDLKLSKVEYLAMLARYNELNGKGGGLGISAPFINLKASVSVAGSSLYDTSYMDTHFNNYRKALDSGDIATQKRILNELHKIFAMLPSDEQKHAELILHDVERGSLVIEKDKTFSQYLKEYLAKFQTSQIRKFALFFGIDGDKLETIIESNPTDLTINELGRFDSIVDSVNMTNFKKYLETKENRTYPTIMLKIKMKELLRKTILKYNKDEVEQLLTDFDNYTK